MKLRNVSHFFREAGVGIWRNGWMSFASIVVVVLTLLIMGSFTIINLNIQAITDEIKSQVEIIAYLEEETEEEPEAVDELRSQLTALNGVQQVSYVTKDEALDRLRERLGDRAGITDGLERNPLPSSFEVRPHDPEQTAQLAASIAALPGVESVDFGQEIVDQLLAFTDGVQMFGYAIIAFLGVISLFLIANTIKLTVYSRRRQINIMKFVGATDWFIRWPFILEGVFLGFLGALITYLILFYGYSVLYQNASAWMYHNFMSVRMVVPEVASRELLRILFAMGAGIGAVGSGISVRRFLKV
ncbi:MAG: ABC transporter permease [Firmicutes bacterium]|nr:ABC transporter permease [Bacillota bacterium]